MNGNQPRVHFLGGGNAPTLTHAIDDRLDHPTVDLFSVPMTLDLLQECRDESIVIILDHAEEKVLFPLDE